MLWFWNNEAGGVPLNSSSIWVLVLELWLQTTKPWAWPFQITGKVCLQVIHRKSPSFSFVSLSSWPHLTKDHLYQLGEEPYLELRRSSRVWVVMVRHSKTGCVVWSGNWLWKPEAPPPAGEPWTNVCSHFASDLLLWRKSAEDVSKFLFYLTLVWFKCESALLSKL